MPTATITTCRCWLKWTRAGISWTAPVWKNTVFQMQAIVETLRCVSYKTTNMRICELDSLYTLNVDCSVYARAGEEKRPTNQTNLFVCVFCFCDASDSAKDDHLINDKRQNGSATAPLPSNGSLLTWLLYHLAPRHYYRLHSPGSSITWPPRLLRYKNGLLGANKNWLIWVWNPSKSE